MNTTYEKRKAAGQCQHCGRADERTRSGKALCSACRKKQTLRERRRRSALIRMGRCPCCGQRKAQDGWILCVKCRERARLRKAVEKVSSKYHSYQDAYAKCPYYLGGTKTEILCSGLDGTVSDVLRFRRTDETQGYRAHYCDSIRGCQECKRYKIRADESGESE